MFLYIIRHAWAGQHGDPNYPDDSLRPLTEEGKKRFRKMVKKLVKRGFAPAHIATSPLIRCRQTAEIVANLAPNQPTVTDVNALAPHSDLEGLLHWTSQHVGQDVAWVGHAPDVGELAAALIGGTGGHIDFAKGAVAAIELEDEFRRGAGSLAWLANAKLLKC